MFELDGAGEYELEDRIAEDGTALVLVRLEVSSPSVAIHSSSEMVESVSVTADGSRSIASIRMRRPEARRKQAVLSDPPRIVLDFYSEPEDLASPPNPLDTIPNREPLDRAPSSPNLEEIRVGLHEGYTRVVFELDAAAEFALEDRLAEDGTPLLLVNLEASSEPRLLDSGRGIVESVSVEGHGVRSVASIRLRNPLAHRKRTVLSGPPRVAIDLYGTPDASESSSNHTEGKPAETARVEAERFWPSGHARRQLVDVRVEQHDVHSLVILELDGPTGYTMNRELESGDQVFVIELEASASQRFIASTSGLVKSVLVEEGSPHTTVRIRARRPEVVLKETVLISASRIEIELREAGLAAGPLSR